MQFMYEDELPVDVTPEEYDAWFDLSWVDGVRVGPRIHFATKKCWCDPAPVYIDSITKNEVWVHNDIQ